jgi:hypothetical protein
MPERGSSGHTRSPTRSGPSGANRTDPIAELPDSPAIHDGPEQRLLAAELAERLGHLLHKLTPRLTPSTAGNARVGSSGGFQFPLSVRAADVSGSYCRAAALGNQAAAA